MKPLATILSPSGRVCPLEKSIVVFTILVIGKLPGYYSICCCQSSVIFGCLSQQVPKTERKKRRKKDADIVEEHNGHIFKATQYSIPTYCEYCSSLIWMMDRACVCKLCRYACHRKCCLKLTTKCSKKYDPELSSRQFGVEVSRLTNEERTVPLVVKLINYIEMHGLYTEGIYRKSGSTNKIKELKQGLDTDVNSMNLDDYNIHVIASVFKQWLRDLPNPLMTFELYEEFLRAMCKYSYLPVI
uniref:Rho-GAP domain-containing protein n=1 Tax=Hucho hucho TaxID=62062 RepID=A0A4W5KP90_9TELE